MEISAKMKSAQFRFVFVAGAIASGKTTLAKKIAQESNAVFFSIDVRVEKVGRPLKGFEDYARYYGPCREIIGVNGHRLFIETRIVRMNSIF